MFILRKTIVATLIAFSVPTSYAMQPKKHTIHLTAKVKADWTNIIEPMFSPWVLVEKPQQEEYDTLCRDWNHACNMLDTATLGTAENKNLNIAVASYLENIKNAWLKLNLFAIDDTCSQSAFIQRSWTLTEKQVQEELLSLCTTMMVDLKHAIAQQTLYAANNQTVSEYVLATIKTLPGPRAAWYLGSDLFNAIHSDIYTSIPLISNDYLTFMLSYKNKRFNNSAEEKKATRTKIQDLLTELYINAEQTKDETEKRIQQCWISSLQKIKHELDFQDKLETLIKNKPTLIPLFTAHKRFVQSSLFETFYKQASTKQRAAIDSYLYLMASLPEEAECSTVFVQDVDATCEELETLKQNLNSNGWIPWLLRLWKGNNAETNAIQAMIQNLQAGKMCAYNPASTPNNQFSPLVQGLLNGVAGINQTQQGYLLNMQQGSSQQFPDLKAMALHLLGTASQPVISKIVQNIVSGPNAGNNGDAAIIALAKDSPAVWQQLVQKHPEIADLLAQSLQKVVTASR